MKYIESWSSEYRRRKFLERESKDSKLFERESLFNQNIPRSIAVMLDLQGVSDNIDLQGASIFVRELDELRRKFQAKYCYICISTHMNTPEKVKEVLDIISTFTNKNIIIGRSFLYGSSYDYETDSIEYMGSFYNSNKIDTFKSYYLNNYNFNNVWFMVADDSLDGTEYAKYKDIHPCLFIKPGSSGLSNFMSLVTNTKGFDGVIESLDVYIQSIKRKNLTNIKNEQKNMICHLTSSLFIDKIRNHEFKYLIRYFEEGYADKHDYIDGISWISIILNSIEPEEIEDVETLLDLMSKNVPNELIGTKILECKTKLNGNI